MMYIKLNNHDLKSNGNVAYYDSHISQSIYESSVCGKLIVSTKGKSNQNPHMMTSNFSSLNVGDNILIFQTFQVGGQYRSRIVTHLLEVIGKPQQDGLLNSRWSYNNVYRHCVSTKVLARLSPKEFNGFYQPKEASIYAGNLPVRYIDMFNLGFTKTPQRGDVYSSFNNHSTNKSDVLKCMTLVGGYEFCTDA